MRSRRTSRHGVAKYPWIRDQIQREILSGKYAPGIRLPAETEWAQRLKVTAPTVGRALNELEQSGLIVRRRGSGSYVADPRKRPLFPGRHLRIGLLYNVTVSGGALMDGALGTMVRGILCELGLEDAVPDIPPVGETQDTRAIWRANGHNIVVECLGEALLSHARHPQLEEVRAGRFDALITLGIVEDDWLRELLALGIPAVLADYAAGAGDLEADVVYYDPSCGYRRAVRYLAAQGLRRIHFVGALQSAATPAEMMSMDEWRAGGWNRRTRVDPDSYLRLAAFRHGMDECGLAAGEGAVHFTRDPEELAAELAARPEAQRPEAIVCHGLEQAEAFVRAFAANGLALQGAGATSNLGPSRALPIFADARTLGAVAAEVLISRLNRPQRNLLKVGVKMPFSIQENASVAGAQKPAVAHE